MTTQGPDVRSYDFNPVTRCNMCGAEEEAFRVVGRRMSTSQGLFPKRKRGIALTVLRCGRCGLLFPDPFPTPRALEDHYDVTPEAYWRDEYFRVAEDYFSAQIATARQLLGKGEGTRALDVGAGIGKGMVALERAGFEAHGLEPSPAFRDFGLRELDISPDRLQLSSLEKADYPPASFHFINFAAVLEHLPDPSGAIEKALAWLAPGGIFHVEVPSARWLLSRGLRIFYRLTGTDYVTNLSPMHVPFHLYEFTEASFRIHAEARGYRLARVDRYVGEVYAPAVARPILRSVMRLSGTGMQLAVWGRKPE